MHTALQNWLRTKKHSNPEYLEIAVHDDRDLLGLAIHFEQQERCPEQRGNDAKSPGLVLQHCRLAVPAASHGGALEIGADLPDLLLPLIEELQTDSNHANLKEKRADDMSGFFFPQMLGQLTSLLTELSGTWSTSSMT